MANQDNSLQGSNTPRSTKSLMIVKQKNTTALPGGQTISADVPETPLPAALQSPGVSTVEDAQGVQGAQRNWDGDGDGSHWSNH